MNSIKMDILLIFERKIKINSINLNQPNNCCLCFLKSKDLVSIKLLKALYLHFSMLSFLLMLTLKNIATVF